MIIFRSVDEIPQDFGPSAVTIGKFDGVHAGHRAIVSQLQAIAAERSLRSVVVTFDRNPLATIAPQACPEALVSLEQKLDLLTETGVDACLVLTFDAERSAQTAEDFVTELLTRSLHTRAIFVGDDFRFGHKGRGTVDLLRSMAPEQGFDVLSIPDVAPFGDRRVSSTWVRELLAAGDVAAASELLERPHAVRGMVVHGAKRGRELGFPTANLSPDMQGLIPADGVYAGRMLVGDEWFPAAVSVGNNPTFDGVAQKQVEAYVLDKEIDLYDRVVDIEFVQRIRGMVAFEGIEPLIAQMTDDVAHVRSALA
ncbi:bifunctional riboflavin kinase/FAD synthetase [Microbacterium sp. MPKO10]|uniref:bifunctional riboflavin kinase/FAD synthetase n=1 Tax=Microbacterium sp. MPKO10 TaxID=2989818 RepID=UPI002235469F|nr:bifunctional riboflavin kinase/FAD synthetase [Microbacterium sp. MPKO10]MCW4458322.1 bifunctional riboflavin kinase/FAD synthetase [Microbacterium sp. MPKO10]